MGWRRSAYERLRLLRSHLVEESNMSVLLAYYLIGVNAVGFIAALICCAYLARLETASGGSARSGEGSAIVDAVLGLLAVCGGGLGIALAFIGFYRAANKATMLTRVIVACMLMIDAVVALVLSGHVRMAWDWNVWAFFAQRWWLCWFLAIVNIASFLASAVDKRAAIRGTSRVKIVTLLGLAYFGGALGALLGMYVFQHKTQKNYFYIGVPLMLIMQLAILWYAMNWAW